MNKNNQNQQETSLPPKDERKAYKKPGIVSAKAFEIMALACGGLPPNPPSS